MEAFLKGEMRLVFGNAEQYVEVEKNNNMFTFSFPNIILMRDFNSSLCSIPNHKSNEFKMLSMLLILSMDDVMMGCFVSQNSLTIHQFDHSNPSD